MGSCSKGTIGCLVIQISPSILIFYSIAELLEERIGTLLLGAYVMTAKQIQELQKRNALTKSKVYLDYTSR